MYVYKYVHKKKYTSCIYYILSLVSDVMLLSPDTIEYSLKVIRRVHSRSFCECDDDACADVADMVAIQRSIVSMKDACEKTI